MDIGVSASSLLFIIFLLAIFFGGIYWFLYYRPSKQINRRLNQLTVQSEFSWGAVKSNFVGNFNWLIQALTSLSSYSKPKEEREINQLQSQFIAAGYRNNGVMLIYFGAKTLSTLGFPLLFLAVNFIFRWTDTFVDTLLVLFTLSALGYFVPNIVLANLVKKRKNELFENFPDALDLMRICVEAGLSLDVAIARVGQEMRLRSQAIADEFMLVSLEQRAGATRQSALSNLATRVGISDITSMVSALIQAERFGSSISDSLRVHSETLRLARKMRAEEQAAKIPTKILLPLTLCIFPILFITILGPAIAQVKHLLGHH